MKHFVLNIVILICSCVTTESVKKCDFKNLSKENKLYILGQGKSYSYQDAKAKALADVISFFGVTVSSESLTLDSSQLGSASTDLMVTSKVDKMIHGAEVLHHCSGDTENVVQVGIKKSMIRNLLVSQAQSRNKKLDQAEGELRNGKIQTAIKWESWIKNSTKEQEEDIKDWLLIGYNINSFPKIPERRIVQLESTVAQLRKKQKQTTYFISAVGELAKESLGQIINLLRRKGFTISVEPSSKAQLESWECSLHKGDPLHGVIRFSVSCELSGSLMDLSVKLQGISSENEVRERALQLIRRELGSITGI